MYKLTRKGEEYRRLAVQALRRGGGFTPSVKVRVLLDIGSGRQPLGSALSEAGWYGEEGFTGYLMGLEKLENEGYIEEVD